MGIVETEYFTDENGVEMKKDIYANGMTITGLANEPITTEPELSQLDRIESMVAKSQEEIAQEARDAYTLELIEGGVIA